MNFLVDQACRPDFHGRLALAEGTAAGMGFGGRTRDGHWWYDGIAERGGAAHSALLDARNLAELAVLSQFRGSRALRRAGGGPGQTVTALPERGA